MGNFWLKIIASGTFSLPKPPGMEPASLPRSQVTVHLHLPTGGSVHTTDFGTLSCLFRGNGTTRASWRKEDGNKGLSLSHGAVGLFVEEPRDSGGTSSRPSKNQLSGGGGGGGGVLAGGWFGQLAHPTAVNRRAHVNTVWTTTLHEPVNIFTLRGGIPKHPPVFIHLLEGK